MLVLFFGLMCGFSQAVTAQTYIVTATTIRNNQLADGVSNDTVEVLVTYASGPMAGQPADGILVNYTLLGASAGQSDPTALTVYGDGIVLIPVNETISGPQSVTVKVIGGSPASQIVLMNFVSGLPDQSTSYLVATTTPQPADNSSKDVVTAYVYDQFGNPVADGTVVTFSIEAGTATMTTTGVTTGGVAVADFISSTVGAVQVQAQVTGTSGPFYIDAQGTEGTASPVNFVTIQFTTPPPSQATSYIVATVTPMPADGSQDVVEAVVNQANGQPVADGTVITFSISPTTGTTITTTGVTSGGIVYAYFTSTVVGTFNVQAQATGSSGVFFIDAQGTQGTPTPVNYVPIVFTTPLPDPAFSSIVAVVTPVSADGLEQDVVTATIYNTAGQLEGAGIPVTFTYPAGSAASTVIMTTTGVTNAQGVATAYFTNIVVGTVDVQASLTVNGVTSFIPWANNSALNVVQIAFVPTGVDPALSYITVTVNQSPADGSTQDIIEAVLLDSLGRAITTPTTVTFPAASSTATIQGTTTPSADNTAQAAYVSNTAGSMAITATVTVGGVVYSLVDQTQPSNSFVTIIFTPLPPDPALSSIIAVVTPVSADGLEQDVVTATIYNTAGQLVGAGVPVTFTYPAGSAASTVIMTTTGVTNAQGVATAYFTNTVVGTVDVQAQITVGGVTSFIPWAVNSALNVAQVAFVQTGVDPALSYITVIQNQSPADNSTPDIVEVFLFDSSGNAITTPTQVTFSVPSTTTATSTTTPSAANTAQVTYISPTVGLDPVTATVTIGGVTYYLPSQANLSNPYVNSSSSNYVTIQFVTSAPVTGPPGGPGGGSSGGGGSTPPGGGSTGSNPSNPSGPGQGYTYVVMTWNDMEADGIQADTATAYITDAYLHPIPNTWVIFTFTPGGSANSGAALQPGNATIIDSVQTNSNGFAAIGITDTVVGTAWVDAWIRGANGVLEEIDGDSVLANFTPAPDVHNPQTQLITIVYEALADGVSRTAVEAHVVDYAGQPIVGASVQFTIDSGTAQIVGSQPVITDANGNAVIYLTSTTAGNVLVTATVGGKAIIYGSPARVYFAPINIYVPRVFSPNGDGVNDVLKPILVGIATFQYFTVYNRWGNIIFQTTDPNQGWDGTFKGVPQPVETYLWIAAGIDENGKTIVQKGMTSLVR
jgi:gliding motility-associated-like protein